MKGSKGSLNVFFALLLTTILAVIGTSLESARYAAISYMAAQAEQSALESVFAGYYRPLWERYHLFVMADSPQMEDAMMLSLIHIFEAWINSDPRLLFNGKTADEMYGEELAALKAAA